MSGCLRRLGCLTLVLVLALGGYLTRHRWLPSVTGQEPPPAIAFDSLSETGRTRARRAIETLTRPSGPVFASLTAAEAASLVLAGASDRWPSMVGGVGAAVSGDRLLLQTTLDPSAFAGVEGLGPLAGLLQSRQDARLAGTLEVAEPGRGYFVVREVMLGDIPVPMPVVAALVRQLDRRAAGPGQPARAIPFDLPDHIADVRVAKGRVTLYKVVP